MDTAKCVIEIEKEEEEVALRTKRPTNAEKRTSMWWPVCGSVLPRLEIVFICQMLLIYIVVGVSLFNLTTDRGSSKLWIALLGSSLGYILPQPSLGKNG